MVTFNEVQAQLIDVGAHTKCLTVQHIKQLARELDPNEQIMTCLKGWFEGSVAILCATDKRMLILNKHTNHGNYYQVDYNSINDTVHRDRGLSSTITFYIDKKRLDFRSWRVNKVKDMYTFTQRHIIYIKEQDRLAHEKELLSLKVKKPASYESRSWRALMRRVGNASIIN